MATMASTDKKTLTMVSLDSAGNELGVVQGVAWASLVPDNATLTPAADGASCGLSAGSVVPGKTTLTATVDGLPLAQLDLIVTGPAVGTKIVVA